MLNKEQRVYSKIPMLYSRLYYFGTRWVRMNYRGRLTAVFIVCIGGIGWSIYGHISHGTFEGIRLYISLVVTLSYLIFGLWLGRKYDEAKFFSEKDFLTGVYNRRYVNDIFPKLISKASKQNEILIIFIIDVNNFKLLNDTYGHEKGDNALRILSNILVKNTRETDLVARWGGDEFIIIASSTDHEIIKRLIGRIEIAIEEELNKYPDFHLDVGISIGYASYPTQGRTLGELVKIADNICMNLN
jgi:diguanylate cyclase (GGDEF)-like protein